MQAIFITFILVTIIVLSVRLIFTFMFYKSKANIATAKTITILDHISIAMSIYMVLMLQVVLVMMNEMAVKTLNIMAIILSVFVIAYIIDVTIRTVKIKGFTKIITIIPEKTILENVEKDELLFKGKGIYLKNENLTSNFEKLNALEISNKTAQKSVVKIIGLIAAYTIFLVVGLVLAV